MRPGCSCCWLMRCVMQGHSAVRRGAMMNSHCLCVEGIMMAVHSKV